MNVVSVVFVVIPRAAVNLLMGRVMINVVVLSVRGRYIQCAERVWVIVLNIQCVESIWVILLNIQAVVIAVICQRNQTCTQYLWQVTNLS